VLVRELVSLVEGLGEDRVLVVVPDPDGDDGGRAPVVGAVSLISLIFRMDCHRPLLLYVDS
jgi:hypothetical protein